MKEPDNNPVDLKKMWAFRAELQALATKEFGHSDSSDDVRVEVNLVDRSRGYLPRFHAIPYGHLCETTEDRYRVVEITMMNASMANDLAETEWRSFNHHRYYQDEWMTLQKVLQKLAGQTPLSLENDFAYLNLRLGDFQYWARVPDEELAAAGLNRSFRIEGNPDRKTKNQLIAKQATAYIKLLRKKFKNRIVRFAVYYGSGISVNALVKMTPDEIADAKARAALRKEEIAKKRAEQEQEAKAKFWSDRSKPDKAKPDGKAAA